MNTHCRPLLRLCPNWIKYEPRQLRVCRWNGWKFTDYEIVFEMLPAQYRDSRVEERCTHIKPNTEYDTIIIGPLYLRTSALHLAPAYCKWPSETFDPIAVVINFACEIHWIESSPVRMRLRHSSYSFRTTGATLAWLTARNAIIQVSHIRVNKILEQIEVTLDM